MAKSVYEVITTNVVSGSKDSTYFDSMKAANRWKEAQERNGMNVAEVLQWRVFSNKDI